MIFHDFYSFVTNILYQQMKVWILKKKKKKKSMFKFIIH